MGKMMVVGSGGGDGSDECTATRAEVLKGYMAITGDSDDEPVEGTLELDGDAADSQVLAGKTYYNTDAKQRRTGGMKNNGAISGALNCGQSLDVPAGFTTGGRVTANSLASQTPGNAHAGAIVAGYNAWVNGANVGGGIPSYAGQTVAPQTYAQTLYIAGHYNTGNVVINPFPLPPAEYIRKGANWYGVVGTFEGYVPSPTDLYVRGNNIKAFRGTSGKTTIDAGQITVTCPSGPGSIYGDIPWSYVGYNYLNFEVNVQAFSNQWTHIYINDGAGVKFGTTGYQTVSINISATQLGDQRNIGFRYCNCVVYRIWLS